MSDNRKYLIGGLRIGALDQLQVMYYPPGIDEHEPKIGLLLGAGPCAKGSVASPDRILAIEFHNQHGEHMAVGDGGGLFIEMCREIGCEWFIPLATKMAAGEIVSLEDILVAYRRNNEGREMPSALIDSPFWERMNPRADD